MSDHLKLVRDNAAVFKYEKGIQKEEIRGVVVFKRVYTNNRTA